MREPGRTGSCMNPPHAPTLDEVMDFIKADSQETSPNASQWKTPLISTVTVASWTNAVEPPPTLNLPSYLNNSSPKLLITEQPKQRGMRFRYKCEGRSAGSILGESSTEQNKTLPAIRLINADILHDVHVSVCLVWKDPPHRIHPHSLVGKDCHDGICEITLNPDEGTVEHSFSNLGIQCIRKKEIESSVKARLKLGIDPFNAGMWRHHEEVDLNVVRLCFQAWYTSMGHKMTISPVLSEPVYDKKSTNTSELKICRMNRDYGGCEGGDEIYILCDKVQKEDIQVMFIGRSWEARADFCQADVHRQIAIVLRTPPYQDLKIKDPAPVKVCLQRITDGIRSEGMDFTYLPKISNSRGLLRKRPRLTSPCEEFTGPDPHGIELKINKAMPDYMNHCTSAADFGLGNSEPFPPFDYFPEVSFQGTFGPGMDDTPQLIESQSNFEAFTSWCHQDIEEPAARCFEDFPPVTDDEATASLVVSSLVVTEETGFQFSNCSYPEDTRMGGC